MYEKLANLIIKKVYSAVTMYTEEGTKVQRKNRLSWAILIKYEGETVYTWGNKTYLSNANNLMILPKGSNYVWNCTKAGHFSIIEFDCDATSRNIYSLSIKNSEQILKIFKSLEYKRLAKHPLCEMESIKETYSILLKLLKSAQETYTPMKKERKLLPSIEYISTHYNTELRNDDLAKITGLSTVYFRKLFTEVYGISPMNYVKNLRIKKAKEMLKSDHGSITSIAISLGYLSISDFSRDFKKHVGVSPSNYR